MAAIGSEPGVDESKPNALSLGHEAGTTGLGRSIQNANWIAALHYFFAIGIAVLLLDPPPDANPSKSTPSCAKA
jgi:hypothetical protein